MNRIAAAVLTSALAVASLAPQQPLVESIEVRVANIDVVVRDRAGNPVNGLTKDDFELYEDGKPQPLTNFYEIRRGEDESVATSKESQTAKVPQAPLTMRQRRIVVFFDSASLNPLRTRAISASVLRFIDAMHAEDRAMLVTYRFGLHVITPFTGDKAELRRGVDQILKMGPAGQASPIAIDSVKREIDGLAGELGGRQAGKEIYAKALSIAERYSIQLESQEIELLNALQEVASRMAGLEGRKVLLFVSETMPERPGLDVYRYANYVIGSHVASNDTPNDSSGPSNELAQVMDTGARMTLELDRATKRISANGVTVYAIGVERTEDDARDEPGASFATDANTASALQNLAEGTGGVARTRTSNFQLAFDTINRDLSSYYSLGYKPKEGTHQIRVKTRNRAWTVRTRPTFKAKSGDEQMTDLVLANLYTEAAQNDWPLAIRAGKAQGDGRSLLVPIEIEIPSIVTLLPQTDGRLVGGFTLYFVASTSDGNISPVLRRPEKIAIPPGSESVMRAKPMTFTTALRMKRGENVISVAIVDTISGVQGFARATVVAR